MADQCKDVGDVRPSREGTQSWAPTADLLIELLSEEIPARMQARAADDFRRLFREGLSEAELRFSRDYSLVTPRRLALVVEGLPPQTPMIKKLRLGPRVGAPDAAIEGFLRSVGASREDLRQEQTKKGLFYVAQLVTPFRSTSDAIIEILRKTIVRVPWPKSMRWGASAFRWVRPLHGILVVFDGRPVPFVLDLGGNGEDQTLRLESTNCTVGHRFLAPHGFEVLGPADYRANLEDRKVIVDQDRRRQMIEKAAQDLAAEENLALHKDPALLDEVTGLVEWPVVLMGRIDAAFMHLPREVLITAMRMHQKYFSVVDVHGRLAPRFIVVANMETPDEGRTVVAGNERVLRARLSDAQFFWDQDRKRPLAARVEKLSERVFHARLGSDLARTERLESLARTLARYTGADPELCARAARLSKADLTTGLVGEFPELQGIMGRYYALNDGEHGDVADAIAQHYAPLGPSDRCPRAPVAVTVALADKLDTLVGFFGIGEKPTGSGDPYALRRAALGVIRLVVENGVRVGLRAALMRAAAGYAAGVLQTEAPPLAAEILAFFADRLKVHLREQGVRHDLIAAVFATGSEDDLVRLLARVEALRGFLNTEDGANVLIAYRRASNIVRIEENRESVSYGGAVDPALFVQPEETHLHNELTNAHEGIAAALTAERFGEAMSILARLRAPVDAFFDQVTVNCAKAEMRANRLRLLSQIRSAPEGVADFSQIEG